jgi:SAM-dependent methyltransferase
MDYFCPYFYSMSKELWNERYQHTSEYIYGKSPNLYFEQVIRKLRPSLVLLPADGEGRNAVFAAKFGCDVYAFDQSEAAMQKALLLAKEQQVKIDYRIADLENVQYQDENFDLIGLVYIHLPETIRRKIFRDLIRFLRPGGYVMLEAFTKKHFGNTSSGPKTVDLLYEASDVREDFAHLEIVEFYETNIEIDEGPLHQGPAEIVRLLARKPV